MEKHIYRYFVSYYYYWRPKSRFMSLTNNNQVFQADFGNSIVEVNNLIEESVEFIEKLIVNKLRENIEIKDEKIIIISFQLIKEYDKESEG